MRVLWASHVIPYPPKAGVLLRSYHLLRGIASRHDVDLIAFIQEVWLRIFYPSLEEALDDCRRELLGLCRSVTFLPIESLKRPGGQPRTALEALVLPSSYTIRWLQSATARQAFARASREPYALAHFDTIGLAPYRQFFADTPATLGHHNIESHMLLRRADNERNPLKRLYFWQEGRRVQRYEARTAGLFEAHVACSELDCERLRKIAPAAKAVAIPNGVDIEYFRSIAAAISSPPSIIFVGSLNWYPNVAAVLFLLKEIWPAVKAAVPDLRLDIVGSAPPQAVLGAAAALEHVTVHGFVNDVRPLMNAATLYVCPIRDGGGTKLKLLDAFAMCKCVIAHPIACEGIDVTPGRDVEFADSAGAFVEAIRRMLADPAERARRGQAARQLVVERYSFAEIGRRLCEVFESAAAGRPHLTRSTAPGSRAI
ncbi:MAG TPA: glycosyltransferase [Steroidobacteraceae bacterium]